MSSEAHNKATSKWRKANKEQIVITMATGEREIIQDWAAYKGKSVNAYVNDLIENDCPELHDVREGKRKLSTD